MYWRRGLEDANTFVRTLQVIIMIIKEDNLYLHKRVSFGPLSFTYPVFSPTLVLTVPTISVHDGGG